MRERGRTRSCEHAAVATDEAKRRVFALRVARQEDLSPVDVRAAQEHQDLRLEKAGAVPCDDGRADVNRLDVPGNADSVC